MSLNDLVKTVIVSIIGQNENTENFPVSIIILAFKLVPKLQDFILNVTEIKQDVELDVQNLVTVKEV